MVAVTAVDVPSVQSLHAVDVRLPVPVVAVHAVTPATLAPRSSSTSGYRIRPAVRSARPFANGLPSVRTQPVAAPRRVRALAVDADSHAL